MKKHSLFINNRIIVFILFFLFLFSNKAVTANHLSYIWKRLSYAEGLSNPRITSLIEDTKGTFWVGTRNGLNRVIGGSVHSYLHTEDELHSIPNNNVSRVMEDEQGNIWVLCGDAVAIYNPLSDYFDTVELDGHPLMVQSIQMANDGVLLGSHGMIYKYTYADQKIKIYHQLSTNNQFAINHILVLDDSHFLLLNYINGVYMLDVDNDRCWKIFEEKGNVCAWGSVIDSKRQIWIPLYNNGVMRMHYDGNGKLSDWKHYYHKDPFYRTLSVISMLETSSGEILVGTDGGGIWQFDPHHDEFVEKKELEKEYHMPLTSVTNLWKDSNNNIWAGTVRSGVIIMKEIALQHLKVSEDYYALSCLFTDEQSKECIWLGMDSGGLYEYEKNTNRFEKIVGTATKKIVSITRYSPHQLLLSSYDDGLYVFDTNTHTLHPYPIQAELFIRLFASQNTVYLIRKSDTIRLLTWHKSYELTPQGLCDVYDIPHLQEQLIPIGCRGNFAYGICGKQIINFFAANRQQATVYTNSQAILAAYALSEEEYFVADRHALKRVVNGKTDTIAVLPSVVQYLLCDNNERLWAFASDRIYCYNLREKRMNMLSYQAEPISCQTALCDAAGDIFWGGVGNFCRIYSDISLPQTETFEVIPLLLSIDNKILLKWDALSFPYNFNSLKLTFKISGKDIFTNTKDKFILEGVNCMEIETTDNQLEIYTLPPGKYKLKHVMADEQGATKEVHVLDFEVRQPWWFSPMAFFVYFLILFISVCLFLHIQNKKREQEFFWSLKEHEKQMSDEKVRFLINISHELRTPLTLIYNPLKDMIKKDFMPKNEVERLKKILLQVKNMTNLINMTLNARKAEMQGEELDVEDTELNIWVKDVCDEFALELEARNLELNLDLDSSNPNLCLDRKKCKIVLFNILMNAMKYGLDGKFIIVKTERKEHTVRLAVSDRGMGIQEDKIGNLFNRFYQGKQGVDGFGIGLSYAKMLVEMHHGVIGAYNNPEGGATFFFEIPLNLQAEQTGKTFFRIDPKLDYSHVITSEQFLAKKYSLLIVDDEREIVNMIAERLSPYFKHIYCAENGEKALAIAKERLPDIIVSDIMMPKMDGFELCRAVKTDLQIGHIPVVLLTACADNQSRETGYKIGADNYIDKPFDMEVLKSIVFAELCNREIIKNRYKNDPASIPAEELTFSHADEEFIRKLNQYILNNISDEKLSLDMIARHMGVSRSLLHNKMKAILDTNVSSYLKNMRIQKSKEFLERSDFSLSQVAFECGFSSQAYFSTVFKNCTGISPLTYRKQSTEKGIKKEQDKEV